MLKKNPKCTLPSKKSRSRQKKKKTKNKKRTNPKEFRKGKKKQKQKQNQRINKSKYAASDLAINKEKRREEKRNRKGRRKNKQLYTLRDGVLNFGTFNNNVMVVDTFFLLNKVVGVAIFSSGGVVIRGISGRRELNL